MAITTRQTTAVGVTNKGAPLTNDEIDTNFVELQQNKIDTDSDASLSSLQFTGGSGDEGTVSWNADEETLDLIQNGAVLQVGQEVHYHVRNNTASTISNGTPVMVTGTLGNSGRLTVSPMDATNVANDIYYIGIATEDIAADADGKVTHFGKVRGINTSAYSEGDLLWLSTATIGAFTTTEPTSGIKIPAAIVISSASNGTIFCRFQGSYGLHDLHDTELVSQSNNDLLAYDSASGRWKNKTAAEAGVLTKTVADTYYEPLIAEANRTTFYRQDTQPSGGTYREGDMWYKTDTEDLYFYRELAANVYTWALISTGTTNSDTLDGGTF
jgi:hypothetical protein